MTRPASEVEMLRRIAGLWRASGYEVFQEVMFQGQRFDLVGDHEPMNILVVGHGKMQLDDAVIEQARLSQGVCDLATIIVPKPKAARSEHLERVRLVERHGLGLTYVGEKIIEAIRPSPNHNAQPDLLRAVLRPGQKHIAPAGSKNQMSTPERDFVEALRHELSRGEIPLHFVHRIVGSPWKSAGQCSRNVERLIRTGSIRFAAIEKRAGALVLTPTEQGVKA